MTHFRNFLELLEIPAARQLQMIQFLFKWKTEEDEWGYSPAAPTVTWTEEELQLFKKLRVTQRDVKNFLQSKRSKYPNLVDTLQSYAEEHFRVPKISKYFENLQPTCLCRALSQDGVWYTSCITEVSGEHEPTLVVLGEGRATNYAETFDLNNLEDVKRLAPYAQDKSKFGMDFRTGKAPFPQVDTKIELKFADEYFVATESERPYGTGL